MIFYIQQNIAANGAQRQQRNSSQPSSRHIVSIFKKMMNKIRI
jgi:hypothetical protein